MLSLRTLPFRNAAFFRRGNLPVLFGVAVGAAVLTGALLVGDSLRGSLRERADRQRAGVNAAWVGTRFIRSDVADAIGPGSTPAVVLTGTVERVEGSGTARRSLSGVTILGVRPTGPPALPLRPEWAAGEAVGFVSSAVAARLQIRDGDSIRLGVEKASAVPRGSLLGRRGVDDTVRALTVRAFLLPDGADANDFTLVPSPRVPLNVYVPLEFLQERLGQAGRCNAILSSAADIPVANERFARALDLADWGIRIDVPPKRTAYVSVESDSLVLDNRTVAAVERTAQRLGLGSERTFVYLANEIAGARGAIAYSIVCATNVAANPPLGPFLPPGVPSLADDEIVLADWSDSPLKGSKPGDRITVTYFKPELEGGEELATATFTLKGFVPFEPSAQPLPTPGAPLPADDPGLTPPFPGITDKANINDWNPPFTFDNKKIRPRDEKFWELYKTTPKAYITFTAGERLFGSRYGAVTSVRIAPAPGRAPGDVAGQVKSILRSALAPAGAGFVFEDVRGRLAAASRGGTDFGGLFLGFSFFLIGAALLLVGLLFRLTVDRRAKQIGLLLATGYPARIVRRTLFVEGLIVAGIGAALGLLLAVGLARSMLAILVALWPNPDAVSFLRVHVGPWTLGIGFLATVLMAVLAVRLSLRGLMRVPTPSLLRGVVESPGQSTAERPGQFARLAPIVCTALGLVLLVAGPKQTNPDIRAITFFSGGGLLLVAGLLGVRLLLRRWARGSKPARTMTGLAVRNAGRNPGRSLLTVSLIAAATFLLVAVESFRRSPDKDFEAKAGGSGGFALVGESAVPIFQPPDSPAGRDDLEQGLEKTYQNDPGDDPPSRRAKADLAALAGTTILPLRLRGGDDASCLNLYQAGTPRVLGVPGVLIDRGGFRFSDTLAESAEEEANPWLLLRKALPDGMVPFVVEQNTAMWMLKIGVGDTISMPDEAGKPVTFRLVGTLVDCPFQSELFIADERFRSLYPRQEGYRVFLIDAPSEKRNKVAAVLEAGLRGNGLTVAPARDRVAAFQAVVGTYLTLFQLLGGFGLILGVLGLAAVLVRGVAERAGELALLRAVGYSSATLRTLVLAETLLLLVLGLGLGLSAAVASVAPHAAAELGGQLGRLAAVLAAVAVAGIAATVLAARLALRVPLVPALRAE